MNMLLILIPAALLLGLAGLAAFLWALRSGQFEDLEGASVRILIEDDEPTENDYPDREQRSASPEQPVPAGPAAPPQAEERSEAPRTSR